MVNDFLTATVMDGFSAQYCLLKKTSEAGGLLGEKAVWEDVQRFEAAVRHDASTQAQIAEQNGTASTYTLYVDASVVLRSGDHIRRADDGLILEVTADSASCRAPAESGMHLCAVPCKKGVLY